ncbi:DUF4956 domain-containing protein [Microbacterium yannicii]|uniref:DUF4956 domain-containing protein n=1 Tax=Microbacterium yannicii TaxID=671622 RepID=UPI000312B56B|nr:DUF4956 domain-containing protein [Microbacterium yannicii]
MTTSALILFGVDLAAATILSLGLYYRRHRRRDLVVAFMGVNVGVMAVAAVLGTAEVAMGLGLGLFGVLSIIRLRSSEISQREVSYYFAALAIGLLSGLPQTDPWPVVGLIALMLAVLWAADHPALLARSRHQIVRLDRAVSDETVLRAELGQRLGGTVTSVTVQELDLVNDTTLVDVRYRIDRARTRRMSRTVTTTTDAAATRTRAVPPATAASGAAVVSDSNLAEARR